MVIIFVNLWTGKTINEYPKLIEQDGMIICIDGLRIKASDESGTVFSLSIKGIMKIKILGITLSESSGNDTGGLQQDNSTTSTQLYFQLGACIFAKVF